MAGVLAGITLRRDGVANGTAIDKDAFCSHLDNTHAAYLFRVAHRLKKGSGAHSLVHAAAGMTPLDAMETEALRKCEPCVAELENDGHSNPRDAVGLLGGMYPENVDGWKPVYDGWDVPIAWPKGLK